MAQIEHIAVPTWPIQITELAESVTISNDQT